MKTNGYSKLLLFYLSFEVDGCVFYLRAWSNILPCLIVGGDGVISRVKVFSPVFKMGRSKQNDSIEHLKFSLKLELLIKWGRWGSWVVDKLIFRTACNSNNFCLSCYLVYLG